jgi:hypothetical protein
MEDWTVQKMTEKSDAMQGSKIRQHAAVGMNRVMTGPKATKPG